MPRKIPRIESPSVDEFVTKYVRTHEPVIIRGLFVGQPLAAITDLAALRAKLGHVPIQLTSEYTNNYHLVAAGKPVPRVEQDETTIDAYCARLQREPTYPLMGTENMMSPDIEALYELPLIPRALQDPSGVITFVFIGPQGGCSSMHFDGAITSNFHHHVFGRKRWILAPPRSALKLNPIEVSSGYRPATMSEPDKARLVDYIDGWDDVLEPGETLFIPVQFWHHVEYPEPSFSFVMRFSRNPYTMWIAMQCHRDFCRQNFAAKLHDAEAARTTYRADFEELRAACERPYEDHRAKYRAVREVLREIYSRACPEALPLACEWSSNIALEEHFVVDLEKTYEHADAMRDKARSLAFPA